MTDPFDTVRAGIVLAGLTYLEPALASIEERLASRERELKGTGEALANADRRAEAAEQERDALQHIIDCADTPLMRDVLRERDEALHAEEVAEQYREKAEARVVELEELLASLKVCRP